MVYLSSKDYKVCKIVLSAIKVNIFDYMENHNKDAKGVAINNLHQLSYLLLKNAVYSLVGGDNVSYNSVSSKYTSIETLGNWVLPRLDTIEQDLRLALKKDFTNITKWTEYGVFNVNARIESIQRAYKDLDKFLTTSYTTSR